MGIVASELGGDLGRLLPALLDLACKGAVVFIVCGAMSLRLRRASAGTRHAAWCAGIVGVLLLPVLGAALPEWRVLPVGVTRQTMTSGPMDRTGASPPAPAGSISQKAEVAANPAAAAGVSGTGAGSPRASGLPWEAWVVLIWAGGVAASLVPLVLAVASLRRLERGASVTRDPGRLALLREVAGQLGVRRAVVLMESDRRAMPMVWGVLRPRVLLPTDAAGWPAERVRTALMHELAHVRRGDCLTQLAAHVACACHWFNPLAWVARRRVVLEQEMACDEMVLAAGAVPSGYAGLVLEVATGFTVGRWAGGASIAMARESQLEQRVRAILAPRRGGASRRAVAALAVAVLGVTAALATLHVQAAPATGPAGGSGASETPVPASARPDAAEAKTDLAEMLREFPMGIWNIPVSADARTVRGKWVVLYDLDSIDRSHWVDPGTLAMADDADGAAVAARAGKGHVYLPEPDVMVPVNGTRLAPLRVREVGEGSPAFLWRATTAGMTKADVARQVAEYDRGHKDKRVRLVDGGRYAALTPGGALVLMEAFGKAGELTVQFVPVGEVKAVPAATGPSGEAGPPSRR